jgi:hypothetical protein
MAANISSTLAVQDSAPLPGRATDNGAAAPIRNRSCGVSAGNPNSNRCILGDLIFTVQNLAVGISGLIVIPLLSRHQFPTEAIPVSY